MGNVKFTVLTHGGAGSSEKHSDGTEKAVHTCYNASQKEASLVHAVCLSVGALEDDGRFNAGAGAHARENGKIQHDAAVADGAGRFGAVAALEGFKNPVYVAEAVSETEYRVLAGSGAAEFASRRNFEKVNRKQMSGRGGQDFSTSSSTDTVGCAAFDGTTFVVGLSTGGKAGVQYGRVGDVPILGSGLYAGPEGAVAATGDGEAIIMNMTAFRTYQLIEKGMAPDKIVEEVLGWFPESDAFGIILVTQKGHAGGSNRSMAWSAREFC